ncbi:hypothetical protein FGG08_001189 [Glutinoglossum americanum]|uniref:Uncharacterized protein n=1 Tax=Glutinoglossum americanum TaxID=1670608 RepID=A0A9P8I7D3_9PEZI|nr:hypothetical protein FGG08_001189 [Glutinoglossum americanum]
MYGKKKMALMSSFPFDGDERPSEGRRKRSAYSRLPREPTITEKPFLENEIHDDNTIESSNVLEKGGRIGDKDERSREVQVDSLNKPLPELPEPPRGGYHGPALGTKTILFSKSTNTRLKPETANAVLAKQNHAGGKIDKRFISAPLRQNPVSYPGRMPQHELSQKIVQDLDTKHSPTTLTSIADAEELELKIKNLIASSSGNDAGKIRVGDGVSKAKDLGRSRRLRRGKEVFAKVRDAITDKFSPNSGKCPTADSFLSSKGLERAQGGESDRKKELNTNVLFKRRIAEERNHSNYKAQLLTGVGNTIRRKPLPIYDNMSTAGAGNGLPEDPFSDDHEVGNADHKGPSSASPSKAPSHKGKRKSRLLNSLGVLPVDPQMSRESKFVEATSPLPVGRSVSLEIFPTSPKGYSTPKIRLEPSYDPNGRKKLAAFGFEGGEQPLEFSDTKSDGGVSSISLKRKKGKEVGLGVVTKKAKRKTVSKDIETLTGRLGSLRASASADLTRSPRGSIVAIGLDLLSVRKPKMVRGRSGMDTEGIEIGLKESLNVVPVANDEVVREDPEAQEAINDDVDMDELQMDVPEHNLRSRRGLKSI